MSTEYQPFEPKAQDPVIRNWREMYYDPEQLMQPGNTLGIVIEGLDDLIASSNIGRTYRGDAIESWESYTRSFAEQIGETVSGRVIAHVDVRSIRYGAFEPLRERVEAVISYEDYDGRPLSSSAFELRRYAGGLASMEVQESLDGVAAALAQDDESFLRAVRWTEGTEYDATRLFDEITRLHDLQEGGGTVSRSELATKWYD